MLWNENIKFEKRFNKRLLSTMSEASESNDCDSTCDMKAESSRKCTSENHKTDFRKNNRWNKRKSNGERINFNINFTKVNRTFCF